jgi:hypothetical protein
MMLFSGSMNSALDEEPAIGLWGNTKSRSASSLGAWSFSILSVSLQTMNPYTSLAVRFSLRMFPFQSVLGVIAATRSFEPDPHWEIDLSACVKGTFRGCTRSRLRI